MEIYSIGFTHKSAEEFFGLLKAHRIQRLLDIRLSNTSQLAGFAKQADLTFFLRELCGAAYEHQPLLAPTEEIFVAFKKQKGDFAVFEKSFLRLMRSRKIESALDPVSFNQRTVLLCSEATPEHCHRRLVLEYLQQHWPNIAIRHL